MQTIKKISVLHTSVPLQNPYRLSFGDLNSFESLFVVIYCNDSIGLGESTPLFGYNWEDINSVSKKVLEISPSLIGITAKKARELILRHQRETPFAVSCLLSALDIIEDVLRIPNKTFRIPIIKNIDISDANQAVLSLNKDIENGFSRFKIKVGRNILKELPILNSVISSSPEKVLFRCDANKAFSYEEALLFAEGLYSPERIEYIEQPFAEDCWEKNMRFRNDVSIPITLDESIYTLDDVKSAFKTRACENIKLKLMKHGGIRETISVGREAHQLGFKLILGNGVQTNWGCYLEGIIYEKLELDTYGEMVGFMKQKHSFLDEHIAFQDGSLCLKYPPPEMETIIGMIKGMAKDTYSFS